MVEDDGGWDRVTDWLLGDEEPTEPLLFAGRVLVAVLLVGWTWRFIAWPMRADVIGASFLHLVNLPFHEASHIFFAPFGELMTSLGGSLGQVLVPLICTIAFLTASYNPFGAAVCLWWTGENFMDVAVYINDARALDLVLLGGRTGAEVEGHDWENVLRILGRLHEDHTIAWATHRLGAVLTIAALLWAAGILGRQARRFGA